MYIYIYIWHPLKTQPKIQEPKICTKHCKYHSQVQVHIGVFFVGGVTIYLYISIYIRTYAAAKGYSESKNRFSKIPHKKTNELFQVVGPSTWPPKSYHPKRKVVFQPSFFRGYVKLQGCFSPAGNIVISGGVLPSRWTADVR